MTAIVAKESTMMLYEPHGMWKKRQDYNDERLHAYSGWYS